MNYSPVKLTPAIKDYLWGGTRLITDYNKKTELDKAAESWELSTHPDGESIVASAPWEGMKLTDYIKAQGDECLGTKAAAFDFFPILIKLIDAKDNLSIQVHPDDEYAMRVEGEYGKTEMWYIADCEDGAYLYYGLNRAVTKEEFRASIDNNTVLELLNKVPIHKGDVFFIPSGTIHAICSGTLICEVQQNSNTTYRVYDYDRRDAAGNARELHIDKAIDVSRLTPSPAQKKPENGILASCRYFTVEKISCSGSLDIKLDTESFRSLIILEGSGSVTAGGTELEVRKGDSIIVPAQNGILAVSGSLEGILSYI